MTRQQIIADLMACLATLRTDPAFGGRLRELRRGIFLAEELNDLPGLCLFTERIENREAAAGVAERLLVLHLWGAARAPRGDYAALDALLADCVAVLNRADRNPHWARTRLGAAEVYEGGASDPLGLFDFLLEVTYEAAPGEL